MNYKRCFYGGSLILTLLFSHFTIAQNQELVIDFSQIRGFGVSANKVKFDNLLVRTVIDDPLAPSRTQEITLPYSIEFKACLFDNGVFYLMPILAIEEPACVLDVENVDFSRTRAFGRSVNDVQLNQIMIAQTPFHLALKFDPVTLNLVHSDQALLPPNRITISLDWEQQYDLDIHLSGPVAPHSAEKFHLYFGNKTNDVAALYIGDGLFETRPEVITLTPPLLPTGPDGQRENATTLRSGVYRLVVHNFNGESDFVNFNARVKVKIGQEPERVFTPPLPPPLPTFSTALSINSQANIWEVFELHIGDDGMVAIWPLQKYQNNRNPHEIRRRPD
jgi:hypothetical protein